MKIGKPLITFLVFLMLSIGVRAQSFINFETPHVHPLDITPDGTKLLAVNTADNRLEVFDLTGNGQPVSLGSVPVGLDPVSVRSRSDNEAWVVNHISDSVSIVNLDTMNVVHTLQTDDEPTDVVFAGTSEQAFVSCSQKNTVLVFDPANLQTLPQRIVIQGEDPRAMAVSPDGQTVYVAIFESGNKSTIVGSHQGSNVVSSPNSPTGGENPPPNNGDVFEPPLNPFLDEAKKMGLIVKKNTAGIWLDGESRDWTEWISGNNANATDRILGWDVVDNDVAAIDANTLGVSYFTGMMNMVMAIAVNPRTRNITAVGTDATNEIRFDAIVNGTFLRVNMAFGRTNSPDTPRIIDLNPHLDYSAAQVAQQNDPATFSQALNEESIGDPRAIVWNASGRRGYVAGMGSNNVLVIDNLGRRTVDPIVVGEGPTGLVLDQQRARLYVLNKFEASITVVNTRNNIVQTTVPFFDPTPQAIKIGRKHQYDTHKTSGLGHLACAGCHVDTRTDRIAWDLGNPAAEMTPFVDRNCGYAVQGDRECQDFHPLKGPMMTQTLQDIIGHEPHHWRGDKKGIEEFNGAFTGLQGAPVELTAQEMQEYEDFLATIHFPPNPYRNFDNSLPTALPLDGHFSFGRFALGGGGGLGPGTPLPDGNAVNGLDLYRFRPMHVAGPGGTQQRLNPCVMCHTLPTGHGADVTFVGDINAFPAPGSGEYVDVAPGIDGERHTMVTGLTFGGLQVNTFTVPQLRNLYDKRGFTLKVTPSLSGFGYFHDGSDTLDKFLTRFVGIETDQESADMIAFLMAFSGSDLPMGSHDNLEEPPGPLSQDAHAAVGAQVTFDGTNNTDAELIARLNDMVALADAGAVGIVAKGISGGERRGYAYIGGAVLQSDRAGETVSVDDLRLGAATGAEMTFTVVPLGSETRIGIDRDEDGIFDGDDTVTG